MDTVLQAEPERPADFTQTRTEHRTHVNPLALPCLGDPSRFSRPWLTLAAGRHRVVTWTANTRSPVRERCPLQASRAGPHSYSGLTGPSTGHPPDPATVSWATGMGGLLLQDRSRAQRADREAAVTTLGWKAHSTWRL